MGTYTKKICFDDALQVEAHQFAGISQKLHAHFHDYYVIGLVVVGERRLTLNQKAFNISSGDMLTFNPMDKQACEQVDGGNWSYYAINITKNVMSTIASEILDSATLPMFSNPVQYKTNIASVFMDLHNSIMDGEEELKRVELFLAFMQELLVSYTKLKINDDQIETHEKVEEVCTYLEKYYSERITLDMLSSIVELNKYTFVRTFTRWKGITPYRYLESIRIGKAKQLLKQGTEPSDAAYQTGFFDQSHFTNYFNKLTGLTPSQYKSVFNKQ